jgi:WD40 repeat protein
VHRAIAETAERVYGELERDGHEAVARRLLLSLARPDAAGDTRRSVERTALLHELPAEDAVVADNLLARLEKERLLTEDDGKVQISHEALLRHWPRLAGWLAADRDWLRERQLLAEQAQQWEEGGHLPDLLLLRGNVLDEIRKQLDADRLADLGEPTRQYVQAADKRERRAKQTRRSVLVTLVALIVLAGGFAFAALHDSMRANQLQTLAQVRQLLAVAGQLRASDPQISLLLDVEAYRMQQTSETGDALLSSQADFFTSVIRAQVGAANAVAYSPSGALVAVAGTQDAVTVWDPVDDEIVARFRGRSAFYAVAFAPSGQLLAGGEQNGEIAVWNIATRQQVASLETASAGSGATVNSIAFEPRGHVLAAAGDAGSIVQLWDTRTWRALAILQACGTVNSLAISPDGAQIAAACSDQNVLVWQLAHLGTAPRTLAGHSGVMQAVAFSPDSGTLAAATDNGTIMLWVASSGSLKSVLRGSSAKVYALTFRPDGDLLASGGADGVVRLWDMDTFAQAYALAGPSQRVSGLAFSPDGHTIASADADATVGFWSVPAPPPPGVQPPAAAVSAAAGGTTIAAPGPRSTVTLWNSAQSSGPASLTLPSEQSAGTTPLSSAELNLALSPDGAELAAAPPPGNQVDLWTTQGRRAPLTLSSPNPVTSVSVNHAHAGAVTVAAGSSAGYVYLRNIPSSRKVTPAAAQWTSIPDCLRAQVSTVALSSSRQLLAAGCTDGTLTLASQSSTGRWTTTEPGGGPQKAVTAIAFSPDGKLFATGAQDGSVELWDASQPGSPEKLAMLTGASEQVISIAFSSDGKLAISAADDSISLWDVTTPGAPSALAVLSGLASPTSVAWQPRTQTLVGTAADGTPLAWNTDPADIAAQICRESALPGNAKYLTSAVMNGIAYQAVCP